jgi:predicted metal-binding membrane protein
MHKRAAGERRGGAERLTLKQLRRADLATLRAEYLRLREQARRDLQKTLLLAGASVAATLILPPVLRWAIPRLSPPAVIQGELWVVGVLQVASFVAAVLTSLAAGLTIWEIGLVRIRPLRVEAFLVLLPPSMRPDAEGMIREFADVRDADRAAGVGPWITNLKCAWYLFVYVARSFISAVLEAVIGRLLGP